MDDRVTVTVAVDGGIAAFPGLASPFTVDGAELPPDEAAELARLVDESGFFELPEQQPAPHGGPDARTYTVTVERGDESRTLTFTDPLPNPALRQLINLVEKRRRAR